MERNSSGWPSKEERERRKKTKQKTQQRLRQILAGTKPNNGRVTSATLDRECLRRLFDELDANKNGVLELSELQSALDRLGLPSDLNQVKEMLRKVDANQDGMVDFYDFEKFVLVREAELRSLFNEIDRNGDGVLKVDEIQRVLEGMRLNNMPESKVKMLIQEVTHNLEADSIDFEQFRVFLMLYPSTVNIRSIFDYWLKATAIDIGEDMIIPDARMSHDPLRILIAGGISGAASRTLTAPFDRLKVLLQAQTSSLTGEVKEYTGIWQGLRKIYIDGGWRAFFKGNGTNVIKIAPESAIKFWSYDAFKRLVCEDPNMPRVHERLCAGSMAGMLAQAIIYPLEITKTRLAVARPNQYKGIIHCLSSTMGAEGPLALFRGLVPSLIGVVPYAGVDLAVYSLLKERWTHLWPNKEPGVFALLICGATSSTCGQVVAYPFQLIRTRLQTQGMAGRPILYDGMADCFRKTVKVDGVLGLYKGIGPNFLKAVPAVSISYVVYEQARKALGITSNL